MWFFIGIGLYKIIKLIKVSIIWINRSVVFLENYCRVLYKVFDV
ncbi:hypothetical protein ECHHL_0095 [Ehrlichia chaffeensis str. Heartland]|uniref:Uncharacterized protein n=1 Tax=Ehrlichia chaffeensis (strain ATCC CRL-10679 / Arkansas) TaxID=205920 RepID=Q2GFB8_EHRCR|nr:hypothetical protein ECH_1080 [Ehrlichia chaffeensis str. Arkansas]AHX03270.1 hypothetical protein ECHHL_0095 [Ehrlichia chaffeensis str. Heartland]AHX06176.1 hypothetical protein ECHLIB_0095 [Ehrlichia chaffeensis str. Liberty]AHX07648.1 hypothetical protein ECHOSC_0098 [Ehrlichia chaffeensis str. Osceola]AHX08365.1 hypothetical protein ECHSTV_0095 [Ehrlichia chaffeensis str. Saint Vincent]AHX09882.1 hypothetical protein ECHWAK_0093 [Ehrlichia chaffeensis str. Wakulla]AHX10240.1 hypotheti